MRLLALFAVVAVPLLLTAVLMRRGRARRDRLDRDDLRELRRIYRRDNPRGPGLGPLMHDQQPRIRPTRRPRIGPDARQTGGHHRNGGHVSEQGDTEDKATTEADEANPETDGTPTKDQRTMYETENEELA